jgi:hypothetical protein
MEPRRGSLRTTFILANTSAANAIATISLTHDDGGLEEYRSGCIHGDHVAGMLGAGGHLSRLTAGDLSPIPVSKFPLPSDAVTTAATPISCVELIPAIALGLPRR